MSDTNQQTQLSTLLSTLRRYWIVIVALLIFGSVLIAGSPAWAAPVANPASETVPPGKSGMYLPWITLNSHPE